MSFVSGVDPSAQGQPVFAEQPVNTEEDTTPYLEIPVTDDVEEDNQDAPQDQQDGGDEIDYRTAYQTLQEQNAQLQTQLGTVAAQATMGQLNQVREQFGSQQQDEWNRAEAYAATMNAQDSANYLRSIQAKQLNDRTSFEGRVTQYVTGLQKQHEDRLMTSAWVDELQRRYNLTNQQKMMLFDIGDPRKMEPWAAQFGSTNQNQTQARRTQQAQQRAQSGVDTAVQTSRPATKRVRADSNEAFIALAGDLLI